MNEYVVNYLKKDIEGYYFDKRNNEYKLKGVCCSFDRTRKDKALKQAKLEPVSFVKVYSYVNEFLELVREENGFTEKNIKIDTIKLDGKEHIIIDNGILVRDNNWSSSHWNGKTYDRYDKKYDVIKEKFDLEFVKWILWDGRRKKKKERYKGLVSQYGDKAVVIKNQKQLDIYIQSISK